MKKDKTECPGAQAGRATRKGKIARLPRTVRDELNRRLLDGESGKRLVKWLNELPEVKAALRREFGGGEINEQNLSDWKQGGFRDGVAKMEAKELMDDILAESRDLKKASRGRNSRSRKRLHGEAVKMESASDRVVAWFFPQYVAAAHGELAAAQTSGERWSVLRTICADLAGVRRSDHYVERLRIWQEKLRLETQVVTVEMNEMTETEVVEWVDAHPKIAEKLWPKWKKVSPEERQRRTREAYGVGMPAAVESSSDTDSKAKVEMPEQAGKGNPGQAKTG